MYRLFILSFYLLVIFSCSDNQNKMTGKKTDEEKFDQLVEQKLNLNKKNYSIKIGEKVKIYYSINSCCPFCSPRINNLASSQFIGTKTEIVRDCIGCNFLYSINFKGVKKGIDTIYTGTIFPRENCDSMSDLTNFDIHIIRVN